MRRKGFTLVELMVVILIVGILAAVAIPLMRGRIDSAKWSEGKSMLGTLATAIRAYVAEKDAAPCDSGDMGDTDLCKALGFAESDFIGSYFKTPSDFAIVSCVYDANQVTTPLRFELKATNNSLNPTSWTLDQSGNWN